MVAIRADVGAVEVGVVQFPEQGDGVVFYGGFVESGHLVASSSLYCNNAETSSKGFNLSGKHSKTGSSR